MDKKGTRIKFSKQLLITSCPSSATICFFSLLSVVIFACNVPCYCSPNQTTTSSTSWSENVIDKLENHILKMISDLEMYLSLNYLPHLRSVSLTLDHKEKGIDSGMKKSTKALMRLSTLHAYLIIHQTALASSAVELMKSSFVEIQKDNKEFKLTDYELQTLLTYLNFQILTYTFKQKADYLLEYAYICFKYEKSTIKPKEDTDSLIDKKLESFIDFVKERTIITRIRTQKFKKDFIARNPRDSLTANLKNALDYNDFKRKETLILAYADNFYRKNGLTPIIAGYLYMSHDDVFRPKSNRKFTFNGYFDSWTTKLEQSSPERLKNDKFQQVLPLTITNIKPFKSLRNEILEKAADSELKRKFREELIKNALPSFEDGAIVLKSTIGSIEKTEVARLIAEHDKKDRKARNIRLLLLEDLTKMITEYHFLKNCVLVRFINLAKTYIDYTDMNGIFDFIVPFNDKVSAVRIQKLLFNFYPVMMAQVSTTMTNFNDPHFDKHRSLVDNGGKNFDKNVELAETLDRVYDFLKLYKKREDITAKLKIYKMRIEMSKFRKLPLAFQGYFVAFNGYALGNVLSLYMGSAYEETNQEFDLVQKHIISKLQVDHFHGNLAMSKGKSIESNVLDWINALS